MDKPLQKARKIHDKAEKTISMLTLLKIATDDNQKNTIRNERRQIQSLFTRHVKEKMHLKTKEEESEKIARRRMVEEVTLKSYENHMKYLVGSIFTHSHYHEKRIFIFLCMIDT